ncbi:MAG: hypothetical protein JXR78_01240 [Victivallales bacterium]|nr:hypothetical protein [Victivallales bacterium]
MKKVLLLGDSIRMDYCGFVREKLQGVAEVYYPEENGRFAQYTLRGLQDWKGLLKLDDADVVHWNNGLWDVGHLGTGMGFEAEGKTVNVPKTDGATPLFFEEDALTPPDFYAYMLDRIYKRISFLFPSAKIIFALTTPVKEEQISWLYRSNREIHQYNDIARKVLSKYGVSFNDLNTFAAQNCSELHRDWVHFGNEGSCLIAGEVAKVIKQYL